jgi:hypothetical protein
MKLAWTALVLLNAVLSVGAAIVGFPCIVLTRAVLAEHGGPGVDPTLIDDGLYVWAVTAVVAGLLLAIVAVPANLLAAHRMGLRGRTWPVVALVVLLGGGLLIDHWTLPDLW